MEPHKFVEHMQRRYEWIVRYASIREKRLIGRNILNSCFMVTCVAWGVTIESELTEILCDTGDVRTCRTAVDKGYARRLWYRSKLDHRHWAINSDAVCSEKSKFERRIPNGAVQLEKSTAKEFFVGPACTKQNSTRLSDEWFLIIDMSRKLFNLNSKNVHHIYLS